MKSVERLLPLIMVLAAACDAGPMEGGPADAVLPALLAPSDGAAVADAVEFLWHPVEGAGTYRLQVAHDRSMQDTVADTSGLFSPDAVVTGLGIGETCYWRVGAEDMATGAVLWSELRSFVVDSHLEPPGVPTLSFPANRAVDLPIDTAVRWEPLNGATRYQLQVSLESRLILLVVDLDRMEDVEFAIRGLVYTYPYWWRVRAWNPAGYGPWSPVWRFDIEVGP